LARLSQSSVAALRRQLLDRPRHEACNRGAPRANHWSHQYTTPRSFSDR